MFTTSKRSRPTMRFPPQKKSLNPVRSSIVQDLRLLPTLLLSISRSLSIISLSLCVLADKCVFQVMSINKKLLSLIKLVKLFVYFIQKCYPSKNFRGSAPNPAGGLNAPRPQPAKQLHSSLATPCVNINIVPCLHKQDGWSNF